VTISAGEERSVGAEGCEEQGWGGGALGGKEEEEVGGRPDIACSQPH